MQAVMLLSRCYNFCHLHHFSCCSILNSNINGKYWKIANFRNKQHFSLSFCTFMKEQSQQNDEALEKQTTEQPEDLLTHNLARKERTKNIVTLQSVKLNYLLSSARVKALLIQMNRSTKNGHKWISLARKNELANAYSNFPKISVPKDAYLLVKAMDILMSRSMDDEKPPFCQKFIRGGRFYDYKLRIGPHDNQFYFTIETIKTEANPTHKPESLHIPIRLLPSLRDRIAEMLKDFDGSEEIGPRLIPKWISENDTFDQKTAEAVNRCLNKQLKFVVDVEPRERLFMIKLVKGISDMKFIRFTLQSLNDQIKFKNNSLYCNFSSIPMREDAYSVLSAMCALSNDLERKHRHLISQNNSSLICRQIVAGLHYDYKLEIHLNKKKQLNFCMRTITTNALPTHKPKFLLGPIPIHVFYWLKDQMVEILLFNFLQEQQQQK